MTRMSIPRDALHAEVKLAAFGIHSIMLGLFLALVFAVVHYTRRAHPRPMSAGLSSKSAGAREYPGSTGAREYSGSTGAREQSRSTREHPRFTQEHPRSTREHPRSTSAHSLAPKSERTREDRLLFIGTVVLTITTSAVSALSSSIRWHICFHRMSSSSCDFPPRRRCAEPEATSR